MCTLKPFASMILMSAGSRSPNFTKTMSPTTRSSAFIGLFWPPLKAIASYMIKNWEHVANNFTVACTVDSPAKTNFAF